jgi:hypothetical protein
MPGLPFDPTAAVSYGRFVNAAYTMYGNNLANLRPQPSGDFPADYELAAWIQMRDFVLWETGPVFYGFVAYNKADPSKLILAIRGTDNSIELWDDSNALGMTAFPIDGCGNVALGFARIYETLEVIPVGAAAQPSLKGAGISFAEQIFALSRLHAAARMGATGATVSVEVTGHSLGSAIATYYVMQNAKMHKLANPMLCTFASPKVGDSTFTDAFNELELTSWRIANVRDIVPDLPPWFLFCHVNTERLIDSTGRARPSIVCCHKLTTYLSVLDPNLPVDQVCQVPAHLVASETAEVAAQQHVWPDV